MRQAGSFSNERDAQRTADYLLTLGIESRVTPEADRWAIWVYDENQLDRSKAEIAEFLKNPDDKRYTGVRQSADAVRKQAERETKRRGKNFVDLRERWSSPGLSRQPVTIALIVICILVGILTGLGQKNQPLMSWLFITPMGEDGALRTTPGLDEVARGQVWRLVTPIFLHFGILHLLFNLLWLYELGGMIEKREGPWRFAGFVLVVAALSNAAQFYAMGPQFGGISGVVAGLFGYVWMKSRFDPESGYFLHPNTVFFMLAYLLLAGSIFGHIANYCHGVGLLCGVLAGALPHLRKP